MVTSDGSGALGSAGGVEGGVREAIAVEVQTERGGLKSTTTATPAATPSQFESTGPWRFVDLLAHFEIHNNLYYGNTAIYVLLYLHPA